MLYVNGRFLLQKQTGVNRFAYEICNAFVAMGVDFVLLCPRGDIDACYDVSKFMIVRCGWGNSHIWEQLALPLYWRGLKGDRLLLNFTSLGPVAIKQKVITIHDLAFIENPAWYSRLYVMVYKLLTPWSAATSRHILTVSDFSKGEIMRHLGVAEGKITVVYNAAARMFMEHKPEIVKKERYILAVSSIDPRKNFGMLLKAFARLNVRGLKLFVIGGHNAVFSSLDGISDNDCRVTWLGRVSDDELLNYYRNATCFVYPSVYEGFGIPPLEAMACGTPVVVSDIPPHREVCGDAALFANPNDETDIANKIEQLMNDRCLCEKMTELGFERCKKFAWEKSAAKVLDIVNEISRKQ